MKRKLVILSGVLGLIALFIGYAIAADDAFSVLEQLEKNSVGLEKPGLDTLIAKAKCSMSPQADVMVYWAKGKGIKTKVEGSTPESMMANQMVAAYVKLTGLGMGKISEQYKITKDNVKATSESASLKDGTKVTQLTIVPKEEKDATKFGFSKMVMMVDTKEWVVRQSKTTSKDGEVAVDFEYKDGLMAKMFMTSVGTTTTITNTYSTVDKFAVPAKTEISMDGANIPENMKKMVVSYSDVKVNAKIPDDIFAAPKAGDVPKPAETAAELFKQAQEAMQKGDMETTKLKLKQLVTYYPDDPMAKAADMMLQQLPK